MNSKQDIISVLDSLAKFRQGANQQKFRSIFGDKMGYHLWDKFSRNYDVVDLYISLDAENTQKLTAYLADETG